MRHEESVTVEASPELVDDLLSDRTWETRSQVVAAEPGREFAWVAGGAGRRCSSWSV